MTTRFANSLARTQRSSAGARGAVIVLAVAIAFAVTAPLAYLAAGDAALTAYATAAGLCLATSILAFITFECLRDRAETLVAWGVAFALRMGLPLAVVAFATTRQPPWLTTTFGVGIVVFYSLTLLVETWLTLPPTPAPRASNDVATPPTSGNFQKSQQHSAE